MQKEVADLLGDPAVAAFAMEVASNAAWIERHACADLVLELAAQEDEGELSTALKNAAEAILNRIPAQRQ